MTTQEKLREEWKEHYLFTPNEKLVGLDMIADWWMPRTIPLEAIRELEEKLRIAHNFTPLDLALKLVRELLDNNTKV